MSYFHHPPPPSLKKHYLAQGDDYSPIRLSKRRWPRNCFSFGGGFLLGVKFGVNLVHPAVTESVTFWATEIGAIRVVGPTGRIHPYHVNHTSLSGLDRAAICFIFRSRVYNNGSGPNKDFAHSFERAGFWPVWTLMQDLQAVSYNFLWCNDSFYSQKQKLLYIRRIAMKCVISLSFGKCLLCGCHCLTTGGKNSTGL